MRAFFMAVAPIWLFAPFGYTIGVEFRAWPRRACEGDARCYGLSRTPASLQRTAGTVRRGPISEEEFRDEIEGLQIQDEQGRYWTIGAQSGQWYRYDGREWVQETPSL